MLGEFPHADREYRLTVATRGTGGAAAGPARLTHELYGGAELLARSHRLRDVLDALEGDLALGVAAAATPWLFVHAGVVEWQGRAIVLPGRSFSGKTTLVAALVRQGAAYLSDEYAVFDARGHVHPFARPLALRTAGGSRGEKLPVEALGGRAGSGPLPVGLVALARYRRAASWNPRELSRGQGVLALFANTVPARSRPADALAMLRGAVATASVVAGFRGEASETATPLLFRAAGRT
ncbi:MAG TPA: hypothetical protein VK911_01695 [Vicinamibacterales bacterium]|nr:hypothetical protein [Vicinamibacterales bacterium]